MMLQEQIPWEQAAKVWGPLGVIFIAAILALVFLGRWFIRSMDASLADARRERDSAREMNTNQATTFAQTVERQANTFTAALERQAILHEKGFDEILSELRASHPRRR